MTTITGNIWSDDHLFDEEEDDIVIPSRSSEITTEKKNLFKKHYGRQPDDENWEKIRSSWEKFYIKNGFAPRASKERQLYGWRIKQIMARKNKKMHQARIDALNATQGWSWTTRKKELQDDDSSDDDSSDDSEYEEDSKQKIYPTYGYKKWDKNRKKWEEFYKTNKRLPANCASSKGYVEEAQLYHWRNYQIKLKNKNKLSKAKIIALNATKGWTWRTANSILTGKKRKFVEEDQDEEDEEDIEEEAIKPPVKRRRLDTSWMAQEEQIEFVKKISALEEELQKKEDTIKRYYDIMERQYAFIEDLKKMQSIA